MKIIKTIFVVIFFFYYYYYYYYYWGDGQVFFYFFIMIIVIMIISIVIVIFMIITNIIIIIMIYDHHTLYCFQFLPYKFVSDFPFFTNHFLIVHFTQHLIDVCVYMVFFGETIKIKCNYL